ncbi:MAG: two-component regulator propeller domain-containing protein [Ferruginibacter sp.]
MVFKYFFTFCFYIFLDHYNAFTQQVPHFFQSFTTGNGLSSNKINDIVQDDNGFLWIATSDGLNRFDGTEVVNYFHRTDSNTIPHNYVYCLQKLPGNCLAIGTQQGLSFYDLYTGRFDNFYYSKNSELLEYNNIIVGLEIDSEGNLWAASKNCVYVFNKDHSLQQVITSNFSGNDALKERIDFVESIFPLSAGKVLLNLYNGWNVFDPDKKKLTGVQSAGLFTENFRSIIKPLSFSKKNEEGFPFARIFKVFDKFFLNITPGTDSLLLFDEQGRQVSSCYFPYNGYPYILWSQQVSMIDSSKLFFIFHNYGASVIPVTWERSREANEYQLIPVIHQPSSLLFEDYELKKAMKDRQGNWWLATTEEGLRKASPNDQYFRGWDLASGKQDKPGKYEVDACSRFKNTLWISTCGNGFYDLDMITGKHQQHYFKNNNSWGDLVWNINQLTDDTVLLGTQAGLFIYIISTDKYYHFPCYPGKPPVLDSVPITTQFFDSHGLIWFGLGKGNGICYLDIKNKKFRHYPGRSPEAYPLRYPLNIVEENNGDLWFTNDASPSLVHWNRNSDHFEKVDLPITSEQQIGNLNGIYLANDSLLWLGGLTSGLIKYNLQKRSCMIYGHEKGLPNSHITSIYGDSRKKLWLVTQAGLVSFDTKTEIFTNYTASQGLPVRFPTAHFFYDEIDKRLYSGGQGGIFYFSPDSISNSVEPQKPLITSLFVNGARWILHSDPMEFDPNQNDITINYTSVDLENGPKIKYAYQLLNEDTSWVMAGTQRQINFSSLAPGHYVFTVRATNGNGLWSKETTKLKFYIRKPLMQTAWFYLLLLVAGGSLFYAFYRFRFKQMMRTEEIRTEISRNLHDEVGATLTNISLGTLLARKHLSGNIAVQMLLDRIYQDSLDVSEAIREIVWSINPNIDTVGEAFPRMLRYASELLEAKDIQLRVDMEPVIEHVKLNMRERLDLYLIFKEAMNNLARHSKASHATIGFHLQKKVLVMQITDDGIGFDTAAPLFNNGVKNMRERAKKHHWNIQVVSKYSEGTSVTLKVQTA